MRVIIPVLHRFGDMILYTAMFKSIKNHNPDSEISVIASRENQVIIKNNPNINEILIFDRNPVAAVKLIVKLKNRNYDFLIDPKDHFSSESHFLSKFIQAKTKIGFNSEKKVSYDIQIPSDKDNINTHFIERCNQVLHHIGIEQNYFSKKPELFTETDSEIKLKSIFSRIEGKKNLLINISAGSESRRMSIKKWLKIVESIEDSFNIIWSAEEIDFQKVNELIKISGRGIFYKCIDFSDIISLVKNVDLIISPDTSIVHIASAFNKPICALYNGIIWNYYKFAPRSDFFQVIMAEPGEDFLEKISDFEISQTIKFFLNNYIE
jgi:ADP-heptose:LPS heptosyltransferase